MQGIKTTDQHTGYQNILDYGYGYEIEKSIYVYVILWNIADNSLWLNL